MDIITTIALFVIIDIVIILLTHRNFWALFTLLLLLPFVLSFALNFYKETITVETGISFIQSLFNTFREMLPSMIVGYIVNGFVAFIVVAIGSLRGSEETY